MLLLPNAHLGWIAFITTPRHARRQHVLIVVVDPDQDIEKKFKYFQRIRASSSAAVGC